jgi:hypothetical protein
MRLLYTSTLCIWDNSTLVMLCCYGDLMRIFYFIKNMFQFLPVALPLELGVFHSVREIDAYARSAHDHTRHGALC